MIEDVNWHYIVSVSTHTDKPHSAYSDKRCGISIRPRFSSPHSHETYTNTSSLGLQRSITSVVLPRIIGFVLHYPPCSLHWKELRDSLGVGEHLSHILWHKSILQLSSRHR